MKKLIIITVLFLFLCNSKSLVYAASLLSVSPNYPQLVDESGAWVRIKGVNYNLIENINKNPPNSVHFDKIQSWGFNFVRFPINWYFLEPSPGAINWSYIDEIETAVQMANDRGLYILIDMHQWNTAQCFVSGSGFPTWFVNAVAGTCSNQSAFWTNFWQNPILNVAPYQGMTAGQIFAEAWRNVVWRLRNYNNVVGWDILNEPYRGSIDEIIFNNQILPQFYKSVGDRIRWSDWRDGDQKHHVLFIEGEDGDIKSSMSKPNLSNFVLSPHLYTDSQYWTNCQYLSSVAHRGIDKANSWRIPTVFSEFGANSGPDGGSGPQFANYVSRIIGVNGQSWSWWDFGPVDGYDNYALVDTTLANKPAVYPLIDNLLIFSGSECP